MTGCQLATSPFAIDEQGAYVFKAEGGEYTIQAINESIIKVSYNDGKTYGDRIYGPVENLSFVDMTSEVDDNMVILSTADVKVEVTLKPFSIAFFDQQDGLKLSEETGFSRDGDTTSFRFKLQEEERIYGTGARALPQNRRGYAFQHYNQPNYGYGMGAEYLNYSIPHIYSSEQYMLFIDNPARSYFDIGKTEKDILDFSSVGGNMAYYFINGDSFDELMANYTTLTGRQPLPPLWAFGHLQSRFGYRNQGQADSILNLALEAGYPIDAIILDIYWFGEELQDGYMGDLDWDLEYWPTPKEMIQNWKDKGVKTITVSEPFFTKKSKNYAYLDENKLMGLDKDGTTFDMPNFYFGNGGLLDIFKPEAVDWIWGEYKRQKSYGIDGWWVDLGEPEMHPDAMIHANGLASEIHGVYGHNWAKMLYEGYAKDFPNERLFKLGRAGYAGSQRFGLLPWSGDVSRSWSGFQAQMPVMLGMGLSGIPYMHSDAGGFAGPDQDSELYIRWMQHSVFSPIFRPHSNPDVPAEPVLWNQEVQNIIKKYIDLRYQMLPYNYTTAWRALTTGQPFTKPLFTEYEVSDTIGNQYLFGDALMVAPVIQQGQTTKRIYLPAGTWFDYWTGQDYDGGRWVEMTLSLDEIPVFVRANHMIPTAPVAGSTDNYSTENLTLSYYLGNSDFESKVYFDDGKTKDAYSKGQYQLLTASVATNDGLTLSFSQEGDGYQDAPNQRTATFIIYGLTELPTSVSMGSNISYQWNEEEQILTFEAPISLSDDIIIK